MTAYASARQGKRPFPWAATSTAGGPCGRRLVARPADKLAAAARHQCCLPFVSPSEGKLNRDCSSRTKDVVERLKIDLSSLFCSVPSQDHYLLPTLFVCPCHVFIVMSCTGTMPFRRPL